MEVEELEQLNPAIKGKRLEVVDEVCTIAWTIYYTWLRRLASLGYRYIGFDGTPIFVNATSRGAILPKHAN